MSNMLVTENFFTLKTNESCWFQIEIGHSLPLHRNRQKLSLTKFASIGTVGFFQFFASHTETWQRDLCAGANLFPFLPRFTTKSFVGEWKRKEGTAHRLSRTFFIILSFLSSLLQHLHFSSALRDHHHFERQDCEERKYQLRRYWMWRGIRSQREDYRLPVRRHLALRCMCFWCVHTFLR